MALALAVRRGSRAAYAAVMLYGIVAARAVALAGGAALALVVGLLATSVMAARAATPSRATLDEQCAADRDTWRRFAYELAGAQATLTALTIA